MRSTVFVASALAAALSAAVMTGVQAQRETEQCYGVAKAGMNDCAGEGHGCAGQALATRSPGDFVIVPIGTCAKLVGGEAGGERGGGEGG